LLAKRRSRASMDDLGRLGGHEAQPGWAGYWFHRRLLVRGLRPVCQISYRRTARVAMTAYGPIRLTMDDVLRALPVTGLNFSDGPAVPLLEDRVILEMKFRYGMPAQFKYLLEEFALMPRPFSKYRLAVEALDLLNTGRAITRHNLAPAYA